MGTNNCGGEHIDLRKEPSASPVPIETEITLKPKPAEKIMACIFIAAALIVTAFALYYLPNDLGGEHMGGIILDVILLLMSLAAIKAWVRSFRPRKLTLRLVVDDNMVTDPAGLPFMAEHTDEKKISNRLLGAFFASLGITAVVFAALCLILCFDQIVGETSILMPALIIDGAGTAVFGLRIRKPRKRLIPVDISRSGSGYAVTQREQ